MNVIKRDGREVVFEKDKIKQAYFLFDKDVQRDELAELADRFIDCINIYAVIDTNNILDEKESPTDNPNKFKILIEQCMERIR